MEFKSVHDLGAGLSLAAKKPILAQAGATVIPTIICPSRRPAKLYPNFQDTMCNSDNLSQVAHTDYAASSGTNESIVPNPLLSWASHSGNPADVPKTSPFPDISKCDGVIFSTSMIRFVDITDGASSTYLIGEKYLDPDYYLNGGGATDNDPFTTGMDWDNSRWADSGPLQDQPGLQNDFAFGSAHPGVFNMATCDGAGHPVAYTINATVHARLCSRNDGQIVNKAVLGQ